MSNPIPPLAEEFVIRDLETLKVVADSLRMQILDLLREKPLTVKQMAADLDITPTKLYYHINLMEKHGLIRVVDTRIVSGILEKRYHAAARFYRFDHQLLTPGSVISDEGVDMMLSTIMDESKADIKKSIRAGLIEFRERAEEAPTPEERSRSLLISRLISRLSPEQADEFYTRLEALMKEFAQLRAEPANAEEQAFHMLVTLYPTTRVPIHHTEEFIPVDAPEAAPE
jgi:DNA-binding transcriptional ArsR family regulator